LTHDTDIPDGDYYVTATEDGKGESDRLQLTVGSKTATPEVSANTAAKAASIQASVTFTLTNKPGYPKTGAIWKVYEAAAGSTLAQGVIASNSGATLTLKHGTDVPGGDYWVTVTLTGKGESGRLKLTIVGKTASPEVSDAFAGKAYSIVPSIFFTLTNTPAYPGDTIWTVYDAAAGSALAPGVTVSTVGATLILMHGTNVPPGEYWVSAKETGKGESDRLQLTVGSKTATPVVSSTGVEKERFTQPSDSFSLSTPYGDGTTWKVYNGAGGSTAAPDVTASNSGATLTLTHGTAIPTGNYWVSARETGKGESDRLKLTVGLKSYSIGGTISVDEGVPALSGSSLQLRKDGANVGSPVHPSLNGEYTISSVPAGSGYTIEARLTGYSAGTLTLPEVAGDLTGQDLRLKKTNNISVGVNSQPAINGADTDNIVLYKSRDPKNISLSAPGEYTGVTWYVDGSPVTGTAISINDGITTIILDADDYDVRTHSVSFTGVKDGIPYSAERTFRVAN
jgi:hypothetical protein